MIPAHIKVCFRKA